jgi:hypothetical protein
MKNTDTTDKTADSLNISYSGNTGQEIRIYQEVTAMPQNETGQELGANVIQLEVQGQAEGLDNQGLSQLGTSKSLIYSGNQTENNFSIYFLVDPAKVQDQVAGTYTGQINYSVETSQGVQQFPLNVQLDIAPVFSLTITQPPGGVSFTHVLANSPAQYKVVSVTVVSNLNKPYQVIQNLQTNMTNPQGKEFNSTYFTDQVQIPSGQKGQTNLAEFSPVTMGEYPVFTSDALGSGATFNVVYCLQGYAHMNSGNFSAQVMLSLSQK